MNSLVKHYKHLLIVTLKRNYLGIALALNSLNLRPSIKSPSIKSLLHRLFIEGLTLKLILELTLELRG